ncbi:TetR/AcrR family transcriptional regulator [Lentilactobacillus sp. Marseille-Q4993]|uniref:TetR/AcrR family transcriptional regulator n=1 Tax=Lentilactobacillus sp. Marseille-Q4993 TaxID=3039492 RepID=UPI0024BC3591|nr:TetR/AcrR family transcriptional regulator [Lentilactobacillus sp. Marseille-Q4993]
MTDMRRERTDNIIFDTFAELMTKKRFSDITMIEISRKSFVHRNTIYKHFLDKYDLLGKFMDRELSKHDDFLSEFEESPFKAVASLFGSDLQPIIEKQQLDMEFTRLVEESGARVLYNKIKDPNLIWNLGNISSVLMWNQLHGNKLDIVDDYAELDRIYQTKKFPETDD